MSISLCIHQIKDIAAICYDHGPALTIELAADTIAHHTVILFTEDTILNERLAEAINAIARQRREEKILAQEVTS